MAVDVLCSDIIVPSLVVSPRISFSHDLQEADVVPVECCHRRSDAFLLESSTIDFDFCIGQESFSSPADELFANGKILPVEVKKTTPETIQILQPEPVSRKSQKSSASRAELDPVSRFPQKNLAPRIELEPVSIKSQKSSASRTEPEPVSRKPKKSSAPRTEPDENANEDTKKKMLKDFLFGNFEDEEDKKPAATTRPFWQFRRSSSLNCDRIKNNNGLIRSLQFLSRSNSTGSAPNPKPSTAQKTIKKAPIGRSSSQKEPSMSRSSSSATQFYAYNSSAAKNRPLRKSYSSVIRINPVLNITPTYLSKGTVNLFGFCSIFSNSKSNKKKK